MMSLSLAMLLLSAPPAIEPAAPSVCQIDLPRIDGRVVAWFNLMVGEGLQPVLSELILRTGALEARWRVDEQGLQQPGAMTYFRTSVKMATRPQDPVTLTVVADPLTAPRPPRFTFAVTPTAVGLGDWQIFVTEKQMPNIFGKLVTLIVSDGAGGEVVRQRLPFRDWHWLEVESAKAARAAEAKRLRKQCSPTIVL